MAPGLTLDAFDFEALRFVDAVVPTPGALHLAVQREFASLKLFKLGGDLLDVLALACGLPQARVGATAEDCDGD